MLKKARLSKRLTQNDLYDKTGITQGYLSKMESEKFKHSPTVTQILALSKALNIDKVQLFIYFSEKEEAHIENNVK
jgi:transcriptional regulator with XRE-family HTH domain